ncbi:MAG: hypothetical protein ABW049_11445, partial [Spongiibacteraceae bacterium]
IPIVVVGFFASLPWLKGLDEIIVSSITTAFSLFVMGWAIVMSRRVERGLDEVQQASQGFAMRWGTTTGTMAFALIWMLPAFKDFATAFVIEFGRPGPGMTVDRSVVVFAMMLGFMGVVLLQAFGWFVMTVIWWKSKQ